MMPLRTAAEFGAGGVDEVWRSPDKETPAGVGPAGVSTETRNDSARSPVAHGGGSWLQGQGPHRTGAIGGWPALATGLAAETAQSAVPEFGAGGVTSIRANHFRYPHVWATNAERPSWSWGASDVELSSHRGLAQRNLQPPSSATLGPKQEGCAMSGELPEIPPDDEVARRRAYQRAWRKANAEKIADYHRKYKDQYSARHKAWVSANREHFREYQRAYGKKNADRKKARRQTDAAKATRAVYNARPEVKAARAAWKAANIGRVKAKTSTPEHKAKRAAYDAKRYESLIEKKRRPEILAARRAWARKWNAKRAEGPLQKLNHRIRSNLRMSLIRKVGASNNKSRRSWESLLGYTIDQLHTHLERQFLPKMGWHNIGLWHVDHIIPLASFSFADADDREFRAAWAITNLRPLWGADNLRKGAKRVVLL